MRQVLLGALCSAAWSCAGVSIGGSGEPEAVICPYEEQRIDDPSVKPAGLDGSANELVAPANGDFTGTLTLRDGTQIPLTIAMDTPPEHIRLASADPSKVAEYMNCPAFIKAQVDMAIDAGPLLRGTAEGELDTRSPIGIRADGVPPAQFETTAEPNFEGEVIMGPLLQIYLSYDADRRTWDGVIGFLAHVSSSRCEEETEMCAGSPNNFEAISESLGEASLSPSDESASQATGRDP